VGSNLLGRLKRSVVFKVDRELGREETGADTPASTARVVGFSSERFETGARVDLLYFKASWPGENKGLEKSQVRA